MCEAWEPPEGTIWEPSEQELEAITWEPDEQTLADLEAFEKALLDYDKSDLENLDV